MCVHRVQEGVAGQAIRLRIAGSTEILDAVTRDRIVGAISEIRAWVVHAELRVVEDVENLGTEFKIGRFVNLHGPEQRHVEIQAARIVQHVAPGVAKGQSARRGKAAAFPSAGPKLRELTAPSGVLP